MNKLLLNIIAILLISAFCGCNDGRDSDKSEQVVIRFDKWNKITQNNIDSCCARGNSYLPLVNQAFRMITKNNIRQRIFAELDLTQSKSIKVIECRDTHVPSYNPLGGFIWTESGGNIYKFYYDHVVDSLGLTTIEFEDPKYKASHRLLTESSLVPLYNNCCQIDNQRSDIVFYSILNPDKRSIEVHTRF